MENKKFTKVSIFMNVFNCHVNRTPVSANVEEILYKPGKFLNASLDKSSEENERNYYKLKTKEGDDIVIVQIAGLIARRIVCEVETNQTLVQGDRIGMIRFGSRVDIYFSNRKLLAKLGQNVVAGESLIAVK
jgi:phosphatidylserine decarboxylase